MGRMPPAPGVGARRWRAAYLLLMLVLAVAGTSVPAAAAPPVSTAAATKSDAEVLSTLAASGTATFLVSMRDRADLSAASSLGSKTAKGTLVYQRLTATADRSQSGLRAMLKGRGIAFTSFWVANVVKVSGDVALLNQIAARPDVARIELDGVTPAPRPVRATAADATINAIEWGVSNIKAPSVWSQFGATGQGIVVANIDTGVQYNHPAVVGKYRGNLGGGTFDHNYNFFDPRDLCAGVTPCDNNGHGTHTMGTMVGDDGAGNQIGVAPGARWIAAKGCGSSSCSDSDLLASGQWVVAPTNNSNQSPRPDLAPDIVNNSWGGGRGDTWYQSTVNSWINAGIFPSFSQGNSGPGCSTANDPGEYPNAYGVGAYDINNAIASFSSRGPSAFGEIKPNIAAPGVNVRSSVPNNSYANFSGTSMAAPHLSGAVALLWSAVPTLNGNINGTRQVLDDTAIDVNSLGCGGTLDDNNNFGEGRLDILAAVTRARGGGGNPPVTVYSANFETATPAWTTNAGGTDTATTGQWQRADPAQTSSNGVKQLGTTTSGVMDLVTGAAAGVGPGDFDIDNGTTTVRSGNITLPSTGTVTLSLNWYLAHGSNSSSADFLRVRVMSGATSTVVLNQVGAAVDRDGAWAAASASLNAFRGQTVQLQVEAADASTASLVEAGVDDVVITQQT